MATLVSHAMRRFSSSPDAKYSSCGLGSEKQHSNWSHQESESALSRSMRYADPWLYDNVRAPNGLLLAPAVALCSCPDYINGTKRSNKKQTTCKKCNGTRLPLNGDSKFGTMRCYYTTANVTQTPTRAGTMRISSTSRPSILPETDPYDLMRRSRMSVTENGNHYRARSVSPKKFRNRSASETRQKSKPKFSTVGRKSILECHVNPYELMSADVDPSDASITLVNGQRIRVRPRTNEAYEEVRNIPGAKSPIYNEKSSEKEVELNRFKSILKKPTATFSDTDCERSPSPAQKSGSHFYLPMPLGSTPRKKVQFIMENENGASETNSSCTADEDPYIEIQSILINEEIKIESESPTSSKLKRSESDRALKVNENKVVFHDSMALRSNTSRTDARILFSNKDLERLDGTSSTKLPKSRPSEPPPLPPSPNKENSEALKNNIPTIENIDKPAVYVQVIERVDTTKQTVEEEEEEQKYFKTNMNETNIINSNIIKNDKIIEAIINDLKDENNSRNKTNNKNYVHDIPPAAPPRKRSNNKQPATINITLESSNKIEKDKNITLNSNNTYISNNATILQINSEPIQVHKLKIKNEFPQVLENVNNILVSDQNLGKTSITINGDDCYSTVKVCDEIPLYQSSVVVKDSGIINENKKSSSVYITGNFVSNFEESKENQILCTKDTEVVLRNKEVNLLRCLSDPVEAVRLNLVPHVCGKSDPPRRPKRMENKVESLPEFQEISENDKVVKFIEESFLKLQENTYLDIDDKDLSSEHSSSTQYEIMDHGSECYTDHSNRSSITEEELNARTKFYELLADSAIVEVSENEDHHYESIKINPDPIYEEIEIPPPLPSNPPPSNLIDDLQLDKEYTTRSIFEGASKYDILSYLVDAKERGIVPEDSYTYNFVSNHTDNDEDSKDNPEIPYNRVSHLSTVSDSSEDSSLVMSCSLTDDTVQRTVEVERNDSGVGSETSKSSLSKYRSKLEQIINITCEDCEAALDSQVENEPLICRKCIKKRTERKEIITEIVETEEKYSRDLQIILEEFYQPMLVAGLLTSEQLSAIFLNVEELLENSQALAERLRDAVEIALEQGDEDLQTVNIGKIVIEAAPMLHAFETYCVRQGPASLLLASLEKDKELLRIFLRVSQMENTVLRRMNLNSFLMVPVQRVTKYPLLLARLYKVTPLHQDTREQLKEAQHKIELHLSHMNSETKDVPSKLWRRISNIPGRRSSSEMDLVNIKLRKIAVDVLEWNHDEAKFALEGRLLFTQPTDNNWRKGRTIKLTPINALLVTNGKSTSNSRNDPCDNSLVFSRQAGVRDAALLLVRDKNGRYSLLRDPLYLDRCVIAADPSWKSYFEVQELLGKDTFIFKAEDEEQTKLWYKQLQYYAQGMGAWRKRRNALANIMINGMGLRS